MYNKIKEFLIINSKWFLVKKNVLNIFCIIMLFRCFQFAFDNMNCFLNAPTGKLAK